MVPSKARLDSAACVVGVPLEISDRSLYGKVSAMCSREVVFTTELFIGIAPTPLPLGPARVPSPPYCLDAPGRKTATALELEAALLPLAVPVAVPVATASG